VGRARMSNVVAEVDGECWFQKNVASKATEDGNQREAVILPAARTEQERRTVGEFHVKKHLVFEHGGKPVVRNTGSQQFGFASLGTFTCTAHAGSAVV